MDRYTADSLRDRLIIAGIKEIKEHGMAGFSLRRVAASCDSSCAAPYKHFKNKEEFIIAIIRYINDQWELLRNQVISLFKDDKEKQIVEVCIAYIRFWVANPNYRFALRRDEVKNNAVSPDIPESTSFIETLVGDYCSNAEPSEKTRKLYAVKAVIYGYTAMLESGEIENIPDTYEKIRKTLQIELQYPKESML